MKGLVYRLNTNFATTKVFEWGKLVAITGSAQVLVQAVGLISGILIIRLLPTQEYALYTLANTMLGTMTILSDGGISAGVMAQGGKVWQNKEKLGSVLATGLDLRKKFAIGSLIVSTPFLLYLLWHHGAGWGTSVLIVLSLIPAFLAALSDTLLEIAPKLNQDIKSLQKNQIEVNLLRLILLGLTAFLFPWAFIAILAGGLPRIWGNIRLRGLTGQYSDNNQLPDAKVRKEIVNTVKRILPGSIYYSISGQLTIWLISIFGSTTSIAQVGALSRLTMCLALISTLFSTLIIPRFARFPENKKLLLARFIQVHVILSLISISVISFVALFPTQVLWILGKEYSNLYSEIILMTIGSCISMIGGLTFSLSTSRGWVMPFFINISCSLITQVVLISTINLSNTEGVLIYSILSAAVTLCLQVGFYLFKILKLKK